MDQKMRVGRRRADGSYSGAIGAYIEKVIKKSQGNNEGNEPETRRHAPGRKTAINFLSTLQHLAEVADEAGIEFVGDLTDDHFRDALRRRIAIAAADPRTQEQGVKQNTRVHFKTVLHAFGAFCRQRRAISAKRWEDIEPVVQVKKGEAEHPQFLLVPFQQWQAMLAGAAERHFLETVVIALGFFLLMRESEITRLKWKNLDLDRRIARFRRNKDDGKFLESPISDDLYAILLAWRAWLMGQFSVEEVPGDWFVCPRRKRGAGRTGRGRKTTMHPDWAVEPTHMLSASCAIEFVKRAARDLGYTDKQMLNQGIHLLRRSAAEHHFVESGGDYRLVAGYLGHGSPGKPNIEQTMRYLGHSNDMEKRRAVMNRRSVFEKGSQLDKLFAALPHAVIVPSLDDVLPAPTKELATGEMSLEEMLAALESEDMWDELVTRYRPQEFLEEALKRTMALSAAKQMAILEKCRTQFDLALERASDRRVLVAA